MRKLPTDKLVLATHNKGKLAELRGLLSPYVREIVSAGDLALPEPEETGETFLANARLKALAAATASGLPALADDGGLCVAALAGRPGIFSARYARGDFPAAMRRLQEEIGTAPDRSAFFICALVLAWPDGEMVETEGRCDGQIVWPPRGTGGHDYDPIFQPDGEARTFAEMAPCEKDSESHRGRALRALVRMFEAA